MMLMRTDFLFHYYQKVSIYIFNSRTPTHIEIDSCTHVHFTNKLEWHLSELKFPGGSTRLEFENEYETFTCFALTTTVYEPNMF